MTMTMTVATAIHHFFFDRGGSGAARITTGTAGIGGGALTGSSVATLCTICELGLDTLAPNRPNAATTAAEGKTEGLRSREGPLNPSTRIDA